MKLIDYGPWTHIKLTEGIRGTVFVPTQIILPKFIWERGFWDPDQIMAKYPNYISAKYFKHTIPQRTGFSGLPI